MLLTEESKEAIRRHLQYNEERSGVGDYAPNLDDYTIYDKAWQELKNEMCRRAGVTSAITADMVSQELRKLVVRRVSRYDRSWVI